MTTKHTPGPWETSRDAVPAGHVQITVYAAADGQRVATAFREEANARLIAAAPDLLAAMEEALDALRCEGSYEHLSRRSSGEQIDAAHAILRAAICRVER